MPEYKFIHCDSRREWGEERKRVREQGHYCFCFGNLYSRLGKGWSQVVNLMELGIVAECSKLGNVQGDVGNEATNPHLSQTSVS